MGDHDSAPKTAALATRPPGLRDRGVLWLLLVVLALQALSWSLLEGYQLADSVEYMERARAFIRTEEVIDSRQIRSFGFSTVLLPIFGAAELFGIRDYRSVVWIVRCLQMAIGLALIGKRGVHWSYLPRSAETLGTTPAVPSRSIFAPRFPGALSEIC